MVRVRAKVTAGVRLRVDVNRAMVRVSCDLGAINTVKDAAQ